MIEAKTLYVRDPGRPVAYLAVATTVLSSQKTLFQFRRLYRAFAPLACACSHSSSREDLNERFRRELTGGSPRRSRQHSFCSREGSVCQRGHGKLRMWGTGKGLHCAPFHVFRAVSKDGFFVWKGANYGKKRTSSHQP